jgi:hypothetical protein
LRGHLKASASRVLIEPHTTVLKNVLRASYEEASYLIAKAKKQHTIGKSLIMSVEIKITEILHGK